MDGEEMKYCVGWNEMEHCPPAPIPGPVSISHSSHGKHAYQFGTVIVSCEEPLTTSLRPSARLLIFLPIQIINLGSLVNRNSELTSFPEGNKRHVPTHDPLAVTIRMPISSIPGPQAPTGEQRHNLLPVRHKSMRCLGRCQHTQHQQRA